MRNRPITFTLVGMCLAAGPAATHPTAQSLPLNEAVLKYAAAQVGHKVGNGECWTLAAEALKAAGAKHARGYTYGRKLAKADPVRPGDIMQFTSCHFEGRDAHRWWTVTLGFPNHTAVVKAVLSPTKFKILQQNPGPVGEATIDFKELKSGTYEVWRPVEPKGE